MNQDHQADEPKRDSVDEFANVFTEGLRRGQQPSSDEFAEQFPELSGEMTGLAKALSVLEEASFRRQGQHPQGAAIDTAGNRVQTLGGFRLVREISRGGMGIVYEAKQESLQRRVAIKVLPPSPLLSDKERARFAKEGRAVGRLHHAHIVQVFGTGQERGVQYTVMQYIEGYSLDRLISAMRVQQGLTGTSNGADLAPDSVGSEVAGFPVDAAVDCLLDKAESDSNESPRPTPNVSDLPKNYYRNVARIGADVADALCHSHHQGVLHRDIKPANILLDRNGDVWVADFGLAQIDDDHGLTGSANLVGTLRFASPEQFKGIADERSDVYSIGMTLYELCTLEPTFSAADRRELMRKVLTESPLRPRLLNPAIPRDLETIILKSTAQEPENRYQSAQDQLADLRNFLEDRPVTARRLRPWERSWRWCRRNRLDAALIGFGLAMLLLFSASTSLAYVREAGMRRDANESAAVTRAALDRVYDTYLPDWTTSSSVSAHGSIRVSPASAKMLEELIQIYEDLAKRNLGSEKDVILQSTAAMRRVGVIYQRLGQFGKSSIAYAKAKERLTDFSSNTFDAEVQLEHAKVLNELGVLTFTERNFRTAHQYHQQALSLLEQIPPDAGNQLSADTQLELARTLYLAGRRHPGLDGGVIDYSRLAEQLEPTGISLDDRLRHIARCVQILHHVLDRDPANLNAQHLLALAYREESDGFAGPDGQPDEATARAIERLEKLVSHQPNNRAYQYSLCTTLQWLNLKDSDRADVANQAVQRYQRSIEIAQQLSKQRPDEWIYEVSKVAGHFQMAKALRIANRRDEGLASCQRAIHYAEQLSTDYPDSDLFHYLVGSSYRRLANMLRSDRRPVLALEANDQSTLQFRLLLERPPIWEAFVHRSMYRVARQRAVILQSLGRAEESQQAEIEAKEFNQRWQRSLAQDD